jgi:histone-lysine N-methyltransferase SETMAR
LYRETLKKPAQRHSKKDSGILTSDVVLLHDNVRPHAAARTPALLGHLSWELFDHPIWSPDLALSDYQLLTYLKNSLRSQLFHRNEEFMEGVKTWLTSLTQAYKVHQIRW